MRKSLILSLLFFSNAVQSKNPINETEKYSTFCRVYGIVKYYSNDVSQGKINWDAHTVEYIPKLASVKDDEGFNQLLNQYLSIIICKNSDSPILIDYDKIQKKYKTGKLEKRVSFDWIDDKLINNENQKKIKNIISSFEMKKNVSFDLTEKNKVVEHKEVFKFDSTSLTKHHYFLGFLQCWNLIEYFYPYKHLMDNKWDDILKNEILSFTVIENRVDYIQKMKQLSSNLNDSHVGVRDLLPQGKTDRWHPLNFICVEDKVVLYNLLSDSLKNTPPIKRGDILTHVQGIPIDSVFKNYLKKTSNSNLKRAKYLFALSFHYPPKDMPDSVCFTLNDTVNVYSKKLTLDKMNRITTNKKPEVVRDLDSRIGYINTSNIGFSQFGKAMRKFKKKEYIIFDCRGYADLGILRYGVLLGGKPKDVIKFDYPYYRLPGHFLPWKDNYFGSTVEMGLKLIGVMPENAGNIIPSFKKSFKGKGVILMNEKALSFGETNIMTLKTYCKNCILIGSNTGGANGNVAVGKLIGNIVIGYTGVDFRFADETQVQRVGIKPDIEVLHKISDLVKGEDTLLNYSLEYVKKH
jgi:Peptidase family S41